MCVCVYVWTAAAPPPSFFSLSFFKHTLRCSTETAGVSCAIPVMYTCPPSFSYSLAFPFPLLFLFGTVPALNTLPHLREPKLEAGSAPPCGCVSAAGGSVCLSVCAMLSYPTCGTADALHGSPLLLSSLPFSLSFFRLLVCFSRDCGNEGVVAAVTRRMASFNAYDSSLVVLAPTEEASFFSLPYIEELLSLYRSSVLTSASPPLASTSLASANMTAAVAGTIYSVPVRCRLEVERELEEQFFSQQPGQGRPGQRKGGQTPEKTLAYLRLGLARALGFVGEEGLKSKLTGAALDDQLLCYHRQTFCLHGREASTGAAVDGYIEESDDELRQSAFLEWFEDLLGFIVARDFSAVQARCVLIDTMGLLESLDSLPPDAVEEEADDTLVEMATTYFLQDAITAQTCALPTTVVETTVTTVPVTREVPDPDLVASLEQRLQKDGKLSKKQQGVIQAQIANAPLVSLTTMEEQRVDTDKEMIVDPYFTLSEAAAVLDYLTSTVLGQWRLLQYVMSKEQKCRETVSRVPGVNDFHVVMEDVDVYCVPPLREFFPVEMHDMQRQRRALWQQTEETTDALFNEAFLGSMEAIRADEERERTALRLAKEERERENKANALSTAEFDRVEKAYCLRLQHCLNGGRDLVDCNEAEMMPNALLSSTAPAATVAAAAAPSPPPSRPHSSAGSGGAKGRKRAASKTGGKAAAAILPPVLAGEPRVMPDSVDPLPTDVPFYLPDVEVRVGVVSLSLDGLMADPKLAKKSTRARK